MLWIGIQLPIEGRNNHGPRNPEVVVNTVTGIRVKTPTSLQLRQIGIELTSKCSPILEMLEQGPGQSGASGTRKAFVKK